MTIKDEYADGALGLTEVLRQHTTFCLFFDFDQIRQTDKIAVQCLECGKDIKIRFAELSTRMFCEDCKDTKVTKAHIDKLSQRIIDISNKLLHTY